MPYKSTGFDTCPVGGEKEGYVALICIYLFVSKDIKTSIRNYKHGTFPFYSSFIKVETDLMCMRRNFSFCVLSPNEVSKTEKKKYLQVHILPLFLHLCGNRKVCSWLRDVSRRFFLHSNACFFGWGLDGMLGEERGLCTISGCSMHLSSACCPNSSGTMGEESPLSLLVVCAFFIFFKCNGARKGS